MFESKVVTYDQPSIATQGTIMGVATAGTVVVSWALGVYLGIQPPAEVQVALATLIGWAAGKWGT